MSKLKSLEAVHWKKNQKYNGNFFLSDRQSSTKYYVKDWNKLDKLMVNSSCSISGTLRVTGDKSRVIKN
jgi:hypothetical protein